MNHVKMMTSEMTVLQFAMVSSVKTWYCSGLHIYEMLVLSEFGNPICSGLCSFS